MPRAFIQGNTVLLLHCPTEHQSYLLLSVAFLSPPPIQSHPSPHTSLPTTDLLPPGPSGWHQCKKLVHCFPCPTPLPSPPQTDALWSFPTAGKSSQKLTQSARRELHREKVIAKPTVQVSQGRPRQYTRIATLPYLTCKSVHTH